MSINSICLSGKLIRDLEVRVGQGAEFQGETAIACVEYVGQEGGKAKYRTTLTNLVFSGESRVMYVADNVKKDSHVIIKGRLRSKPYQVTPDKRVFIHYIEVDDIDFDRSKIKD